MVMATMAQVSRKFFVASMFMWILPIAILYGFHNNWFPGFSHISPYTQTLISGFLAVVSVNVMLGFYIFLAMREPSEKHGPDPVFVAKAEASIKKQSKSGAADKQD